MIKVLLPKSNPHVPIMGGGNILNSLLTVTKRKQPNVHRLKVNKNI